MDNINELINQAMEDWDKETNCGETDPAFQGEVGEEIETLVNGLSEGEIGRLLKEPNPLIFVEEQYRNPNPLFGLAPIDLQYDLQYVRYTERVYHGRAVYFHKSNSFSLFDGQDKEICRLSYEQAETLVSLFTEVNRVKKGGPHE